MKMNEFTGHGSSDEIKSIYKESLGKDYGEMVLGKNTTKILYEDPKLLLFVLSRHKFVSKNLCRSQEKTKAYI